MDSLRRSRDWLRSRPPRVRAGLILVTAIVAGVVLALAVGAGAGSGSDDGEAAAGQGATTEQTPNREDFTVRALPEEVLPEEQEKRERPAKQPPLKLVERPLSETEARVRRVFRRQVAGKSREGLLVARLERVSCGADGQCRVEYMADGPGAGKVIESQGPIWRELFSNPRVEEATVAAHVGGPDAAAGITAGAQPVVVRCDRSALDSIRDLGRNSTPHLRTACEVSSKDMPGK